MVLPKGGPTANSTFGNTTEKEGNDTYYQVLILSHIIKSSGILFISDASIICQNPKGKLELFFVQTGTNMLEIARKLTERPFFLGLNSINGIYSSKGTYVKVR